jgi:hypothetical protein
VIWRLFSELRDLPSLGVLRSLPTEGRVVRS